MGNYVKVAKKSEIEPGEKKLVEVNGRAVGLFNLEDSYYAIEDVCTHDGGPLAEGNLMGDEIECPRHGARFNVQTGEATRMPAFESVDTYEVKVEGEDILILAD
jgi:3-phenylpropionate/trans-cinnamate dioxygenase ferredoxin subunit